MIRDTLFCLTHPFQCVGDALAPWWWLIAIFGVLILIGFGIRVWNIAHGVGGKPAAIGAVGILGTIAIAVLTLFAGRRGADPEPTDIDGPDGQPTPRPRRPKPPKRQPGGPIFPNAPWNRRN